MISSTSLPTRVQEGEAAAKETSNKLEEGPPVVGVAFKGEIGLVENVRMGSEDLPG